MFADRVKETSTSTGTGNFTLAGAATGFQSFNTAYGTLMPICYAIVSQSAAEWEVGNGYLSNSTTLVRDRVTASSNGGAAVNFTSGTKDVFATYCAEVANLDEVMRAAAVSPAIRLHSSF